MLEILVLIGAAGALGSRAQQRGLSQGYVATAMAGWAVFFVAGLAGLGFLSLILRWLWVGAVYLYIEQFAQGGARVASRWKCPDCTLFNDGGTLRCLCGYVHPDAPDGFFADDTGPAA